MAATDTSTLPELCTAEQLAAWLNVGRPTIYRWVRAGKLPVERISSRLCRFRRDAVLKSLGMESGDQT